MTDPALVRALLSKDKEHAQEIALAQLEDPECRKHLELFLLGQPCDLQPARALVGCMLAAHRIAEFEEGL